MTRADKLKTLPNPPGAPKNAVTLGGHHGPRTYRAASDFLLALPEMRRELARQVDYKRGAVNTVSSRRGGHAKHAKP